MAHTIITAWMIIASCITSVKVSNAQGSQPEPHLSLKWGVLFTPIQNHFLASAADHALVFKIVPPREPAFPKIPQLTSTYCERALQKQRAQYALNHYAAQGATTPRPGEGKHRYIKFNDASESALLGRQKLCRQSVKFSREFAQRYDVLRTQIASEYEVVKSFLNDRKDAHRTKRGLLSFLSPLYHSVLGLATEQDAQALQANMKNLLFNQESLANTSTNNLHKIVTLSEASNSRFANIWGALNEVTRHANRTRTAFQNIIKDTQDRVSENANYVDTLMKAQWISNALYSNAQILLADMEAAHASLLEWHGAIASILLGRLPPQLVHHNDLKLALSEVKRKVSAHFASYQLAFDEAETSFYYAKAELSAYYSVQGEQQTIILHLAVPLRTRKQDYQLYELAPLPVPLQNNKEITGYSKLDSTSIGDFFVTSIDRRFHMTLTAAQFMICATRRDSSCPALTEAKDRQIQTCESALFDDLTEQITQLCKFHVFPTAPYPDFIRIAATGTYAVGSANGKFDIVCEDRSRETKIAALALVKLPCKCAIITEQTNSPPSLKNCEMISTLISVKYPANAIHFALMGLNDSQLDQNQKPEFQSLPADDPLDLTNYEMKEQMYELDMQKSLLRGRSSVINLRRVETDFMSLDYFQMVLPYAELALIILLIGVLTLMCLKAYRWTHQWEPILAILANQIHTAKAAPLADDTREVINGLMTLRHQQALLLSFTLITIAVIARLAFKRYNEHRLAKIMPQGSSLHYVIADFNSFEVFPVLNFPSCCKEFTLRILPQIKRLRITRDIWCRYVLNLEWDGPFVFRIQGAENAKQASVKRPISNTMARLIEKYQLHASVEGLYTGFALRCRDCTASTRLLPQPIPRSFRYAAVVTEGRAEEAQLM